FTLCAAKRSAPIVLWTVWGVVAARKVQREADGEREKFVASAHGQDGSADRHAGGRAAAGVCGSFARLGVAGSSGRGAGAGGGVAEAYCCAQSRGRHERGSCGG